MSENTDQAAETATPDDASPAQTDAAQTDAAQAETAGTPVTGEDETAQVESPQDKLKRLEEEGDIAADYLEELLDIADLDGDIDIDVEGDRASVEIRGAESLNAANAPDGALVDALQELARLAVQASTGRRSRLMLDLGGFRADHRSQLERLAQDAVAQTRETGAPVPLRAMNPFERKVVHDVAKREGLHSESEGGGSSRHVVIFPAS